MSSARLGFLLNNFNLSTWLIVGASLQSILSFLLPRNVALLPALILLIWRLIHGALVTKGLVRNTNVNGAFMGRWTAAMLNEDGSAPKETAGKEMAVFVIGARSNHPMGFFEPGFREMSKYFQNIWKDAEADRSKWGYLGKSSGLIATDTGAVVTISYWKSIEHLHAFARGESHRVGWDWWNKTVKEHPHLGIMHEAYSVPASRWENIYVNIHPFGMGKFIHKTSLHSLNLKTNQQNPLGQTKHLLQGPNGTADPANRLVSPLIEARGGKWKSMMSRMGRADTHTENEKGHCL